MTFDGDVVIFVEGPIQIDGTLTGTCTGIELRGTEDPTVDGLITNTCAEGQRGPEVRLVASGEIVLGTEPSDEPVIVSAGPIFISDPEGEAQGIPAVPPEAGWSPPLLQPVSYRLPIDEVSEGDITTNRRLQASLGNSISVISFNGDIVIGADVVAFDGEDGDELVRAGTCDATELSGGNGG